MVRRNPPLDRSKVKVASFRISEGEWFDFSEEADHQNVTATDVIKGAIRNFMAGYFVMPEPIEPTPEPSSIGIGGDIESLVSTAVDTAMGKLSILGIDRVTEIAMNEVELAMSPLSNDLLNLQAQVTELTANRDNWDDMRADVADLREQLTQLATAKKPHSPATKTASEPSDVIRRVMNRLEAEPELKARISEGVANGLAGAALGEWLADGGFWNKSGKTYEGASLSQFRAAIEHLSSLENGA
jgi:hypothetical protein